MKIVAAIESPEVAVRVLDSLGIACRPPPAAVSGEWGGRADHYVFLSNEADVLREMRAFLGRLR